MVDEKEEEYQFADEDTAVSSSSDEESGASGRQSSGSSPVNPELSHQARRLTMLVTIIIISFTVFHFVRGKKEKTNENKTAAETSVQAKLAEDVAAKRAKAAAEAKSETSVDKIREEFVNLKQNLMSDDSRVHSLEVTIEHMEDTLANMGDAISDIHLQMQAMTKQMKEIQTKLIPKPKPVVKKHPLMPMRPKRVYSLTAVVRGRAWIRDVKGNEMTVKPGDKIVDYGMVRMIDPINGLITTTSGRVISYGQEDF